MNTFSKIIVPVARIVPTVRNSLVNSFKRRNPHAPGTSFKDFYPMFRALSVNLQEPAFKDVTPMLR